MIEFHDPTGSSAQAAEAYSLAFDLTAESNAQATVGLLANGFADSERFLQLLGAAVTQRFPNLTLKVWNKGNASITAPESMLQEIKDSCQAVVAAYGH
jgi:hypothetical protein